MGQWVKLISPENDPKIFLAPGVFFSSQRS